jgi:hypothetical protein
MELVIFIPQVFNKMDEPQNLIVSHFYMTFK